MTRNRVPEFARSVAGSSTAEFALVLPVFAALTIGVMNLGAMLYAYNCLHFAAEDTARCLAVKTTVCTTTTYAQGTYAPGKYYGPPISGMTFAASKSTCVNTGGAGGAPGYVVTGTGTYNVPMVVTKLAINLSATACYPTN